LKTEDSIAILRYAQESTDTQYTLEDSSSREQRTSYFSQDTATLRQTFPFDSQVLSSGPYRSAFAANLRDLIRNTRNHQHRDTRRPGGGFLPTVPEILQEVAPSQVDDVVIEHSDTGDTDSTSQPSQTTTQTTPSESTVVQSHVWRRLSLGEFKRPFTRSRNSKTAQQEPQITPKTASVSDPRYPVAGIRGRLGRIMMAYTRAALVRRGHHQLGV
jgi:hypothetical protein